MILNDPEHFLFKNHDFSARAPNCLVYVIEAVQNLKIHFFSQSTSCSSIFSEHFEIFLGSPSRIFRKITVLDTVLNSLAKRLSKKANGLWR